MFGLIGAPAGVTDRAFDSLLNPFMFNAFNFMEYTLPFSSSVNDMGLDVEVGLQAVQLAPLSVE